MILLVHLLFGAAIGSAVKNIPLAIVLAFFGHYLLDLIPHAEYKLEDKMLPNVLRISLDFCLGILLISIFSRKYPMIYICAVVAIIPDGLTVLNSLFPNKILELHRRFHIDKVHFLKYKKISNFWRILSQVVVVIISIFLFKV